MQEIKKVIESEFNHLHLQSFDAVYDSRTRNRVKYWLTGLIAGLVLILFIPWTQNIRANGSVTTLRQEHRPQEVNTIIAGRIIKWHVKEGDFVQKGDTLVQLAEVKDNYLDPQLLQRTKEQMEAKTSSIQSYADKANATALQMQALEEARNLKIEQLKNKVNQLQLKIIGDSLDVVAASNDFAIAKEQYRRQQIMRDSGLSSLVQLEQRNQSYQTSAAKKTSAEVKLANTKTDLVNAKIELQQAQQEYAEKIFKARSERAAAQSEIAAGEGELAKLSNQYSNYAIRANQYYILAPQTGQVVQANKAGINEIIKEGEKLLEIVPQDIDHAVELFIRPVDLPLVSVGQKVRFQFDGYPAVVFSGWPQMSYGIFTGEVVAIESSVSSNGKFRILVAEDRTTNKPWPQTLKIGTGASGFALLKDVPVWYELWRNINGFPPDYYPAKNKVEADVKK